MWRARRPEVRYNPVMSKEMLVIALGVWVILVRTMLGIPGEWQTVLLIASGVALAILGFLLRGEAISRAQVSRPASRQSYPFVETPAPAEPQPAPETHEHKEGITSLN